MKKKYYSLGFMSGTSMDGVDASIIQSDGKTKYKVILDQYFKYSKEIYQNLTNLRDKIKNSIDLKKYKNQINLIENKITLFHVDVAKKKTTANIYISFNKRCRVQQTHCSPLD